MMMKQTASQTVGPFLRIGLIYGQGQNVLAPEGTAGERIKIAGHVFDGLGETILDAMVEIWQPDAKGIYNHPTDPRQAEADPRFRGFGRAETRQGGRFEFETIKPGGRDGMAPFVSVRVFARGMLVHSVTRMYFPDEAGNASDPVLNSVELDRRPTLIAARDDSGAVPLYHFDIHLQGDQETVFFDP